MKNFVYFSVFSLISSFAFAEPAPTAATASAVDTSTRVTMRINLDPFYKNFNDAARNYKTPKVESLRLGLDRAFGSHSRADVGIFLHEFESQENARKEVWYNAKNDDGHVLVNTGVIKYFHFLFNVPAVQGLQIGYVRELEPALYGYTDRALNAYVAESPSFTGHWGRVEGYRAVYDIDGQNKVTYHAARNPDQNEYSLGMKPVDTTWYHKLTSTNTIADTTVETGLGIQGKWLGLTQSSKLKYDNFFHVVAEQKNADLRLKAGFAYDNYAVPMIDSDNNVEAAVANATTALVAARYELFPKELTLIGEVGYRTLKFPVDKFTDFTKDEKPKTTTASEATLILAGQYYLDNKLSLTPSYNFFYSNRANANAGNMTGNALLANRRMLEKGASRIASTSEHALGLRVCYDY